MEREIEEQKQKLLRSEQSLQATHSKEQDLRKKMEVHTNSYSCTYLFVCVLFSSLRRDDLHIFKNSSSLQELQKEKNTMTVQLDRSTRSLSQLEEEKRSSEQTLKRTQGLLEDLKGTVISSNSMLFLISLPSHTLTSFLLFTSAKSEGQAEELKRLQAKLEQQTQTSTRELENMKKSLSDAESENDK